MFVAGTEAGRLMLFDPQAGNRPTSVLGEDKAHDGYVKSTAFMSGSSTALLASAGTDGWVRLWDPRHARNSLRGLACNAGNSKCVPTCLDWDPLHVGLLAAATSDGRVLIWDIAKIGAPLTAADKLDGPAELCFIHAGHVGNPVRCVAWSSAARGMLASVAQADSTHQAEGLVLNVWQPASCIFNGC
eukprot:6466798-Amphidinium_carterae.1